MIYCVKGLAEVNKYSDTTCFLLSMLLDMLSTKSFKKLIDRGRPLIFVRIIMQWYATQKACVRWGSVVSDNFLITNGVRQGGILSPLFFNVYMDCLSESLCNTQTGCNVGGGHDQPSDVCG